MSLRRTLLSPFNYGNIFDFLDTSQSRKIEKYPFGCKKDVHSFAVSRFVSELTPKIRLFAPFCLQFLGYSKPLGGGCYIHLTTESNVYSENGVYLKKRKLAKQQENAVSRYNISIIHRFRKKRKYFYAVFLRKGFSNCCKNGKKVV